MLAGEGELQTQTLCCCAQVLLGPRGCGFAGVEAGKSLIYLTFPHKAILCSRHLLPAPWTSTGQWPWKGPRAQAGNSGEQGGTPSGERRKDISHLKRGCPGALRFRT